VVEFTPRGSSASGLNWGGRDLDLVFVRAAWRRKKRRSRRRRRRRRAGKEEGGGIPVPSTMVQPTYASGVGEST